MARNTAEAAWMKPVAEKIVRESVSFREACTQLGVTLSSTEADNAWRTKVFQRVLRDERNRFYLELGGDPNRKKQTAIGQMVFAIEHLLEAGEYSPALEGLLKLAKVEGWLMPDSNVNVFTAASAKDLNALRDRLTSGKRGVESSQELAN